MRRRRVATFAVGGAIAFGVVGCSSGTEGASPSAPTTASLGPGQASTVSLPRPTSPKTVAGLTETATRYLQLRLEDRGTESFAELSDRCRTTWKTAADWAGNLSYASAQLEDLGLDVKGAEVRSVSAGPIEGADATVLAVVVTTDGQVVERLSRTTWVYEAGGWRADECESAQP